MITLGLAISLFVTQPDTVLKLEIKDTIRHKVDFITTDPIGNIYLISGSTVNKFNEKGDSLFAQNFNQLRTIEYFDASQALKIYAVNFSFNALIVLDNTLSAQNQPIFFDKMPVEQISLLCASNFNNTMWIYDGVNMQLVKMDPNFKVVNSSVNFYSHSDLAGIPNFMVEANNLLYVNIPENGIKIFDQYCNFVQNIPIKTDKKFIVRNNKIYYLENGQISFYNIVDFVFGKIDSIISGIEDFSIEKNKLYLKKGNEVYILNAETDF